MSADPEDEVRDLLQRGKKELIEAGLQARQDLEQASGERVAEQIIRTFSKVQQARVTAAIAKARQLMARHAAVLGKKTLAVLEKYRIAELDSEVDREVVRLRNVRTWKEIGREREEVRRRHRDLPQRVALAGERLLTELAALRSEPLDGPASSHFMREVRQRVERGLGEIDQMVKATGVVDFPEVLQAQRRLQEAVQNHLCRLEADCGWTEAHAPRFFKFQRADLPEKLQIHSSYYPDGQLKEVSANGCLKLEHAIPEAKWEDGANVKEFHADGTIDEYGGRYERSFRAKVNFEDWVRQILSEMS